MPLVVCLTSVHTNSTDFFFTLSLFIKIRNKSCWGLFFFNFFCGTLMTGGVGNWEIRTVAFYLKISMSLVVYLFTSAPLLPAGPVLHR